jgi:hypothetical protein
MPYYDAPSNDVQRLAFLQRAYATGLQDVAAGAGLVNQETLDALAAFLPGFQAAMGAVSARLGARAKETQERVEAVEQVKLYTRDLWEVVKRRVRRLNQPAAVLSFYQLPLDGSVPNPTTQEDWLALAAQVVGGDAEAVAAGYPATVSPSAAELQAVLAAAVSEAADVTAADRAYDLAQAAVAALRSQADGLLEEVMADLRYRLRKLDAPSQRRIMRTYGARFRYLPGEPVDPDDPGTPEDETPIETL